MEGQQKKHNIQGVIKMWLEWYCEIKNNDVPEKDRATWININILDSWRGQDDLSSQEPTGIPVLSFFY